MHQKHWPSIYRVNVNINLMEQNVIEINSGIMIIANVNGNPSSCNCENGKYLASIMDEIINTEETNFNEKNKTCKT